MKPKTVLYIFSFFILNFTFSINLSAQPGWIQNYQPFSTPYYDYSYETGNIQVTDDGCFVVNGTCTESDEWDWYSKFGFLIKFDPDGNIVWAKKDSLSPSPDMWDCESETFAMLPNGGFVSAGETGWTSDYLYFRDCEGNLESIVYYENVNYHTMNIVDNETSILFGGYSGDLAGAFLQKTDLTGNQIWFRDYSDFCSSIESIVEASDGGYALGCFRNNNFQLVKTDTEGIVEWYQSYDYNNRFDELNSIIKTSDNGYLLCGNSNIQGMDMKGFVVKTNTYGDTLWTRKYDSEVFGTLYNAVEINNDFVLFGCNNNEGIEVLSKINNSGELIWYEELPLSGVSSAEQPMQKNEEGFICYLMHDGLIFLIQANNEGVVSISEIELPENNQKYLSCYPNPFNPTTTISFNIYEPAKVELDIFNIKGQKVKTLVNESLAKGIHEILWNGRNDNNRSVASGVYFYKLSVNGKDYSVKKCLMLK